MAEEKKTLEDLGAAVAAKATEALASENAVAEENSAVVDTPVEIAPVEETIILAEPKIDDLGRAYATGKRKDAVARA